MADLHDKYDELLDEIEMMKARLSVMQGDLNRRQEMIFLLRRALEPFALDKDRPITSGEREFARGTMQLTAHTPR